MNRRPWVLYTAMAFGYAFLYVPIVSLIVYSFNKSRLVTVWGGFSTEWYTRLFNNEQILSAAWRSFLIASGSATGRGHRHGGGLGAGSRGRFPDAPAVADELGPA